MIYTILYALLALAFVIIVWWMICTERTFHQRQILLYKFGVGGGDFSAFDKVKYDTHVWYLLTFRDANKLYKD